MYFPIIDEKISWPFVHSWHHVNKHVFEMLKFCDKASDIAPGEYYNCLSYVLRKMSQPNPVGPLYVHVPEIKQTVFYALMEQISNVTFFNNEKKRNQVPIRLVDKECAAIWLFPPHQ